MFKVLHGLVVSVALFLVTTPVTVTASSLGKRDTGTNICPSPYPTGTSTAYPTGTAYPYSYRSLAPRQSGGSNATTLSFQGSQWIWTSEVSNGNAPAGSRAFRKTFEPPAGKTPSHLTIAFAVDNTATLFVNGQEITTQVGWSSSNSYCVPLEPYTNVIAFNATNLLTTPNPAGLLVTAEVTYTDGSTSHIASDSSWRTSGTTIPDGFEGSSFDDSSWATASSEFAYPTFYGTIPIAGSDTLSLNMPAQWIWTTELPSPGGAVPAAPRALRRTITLPTGHTSASAEILIVSDNEYSLYINGRFVGTGTSFQNAQRFTVDNLDLQSPQVVVAVYGLNVDGPGPNPAGLLASIQITSNDPSLYCLDCSSETLVVTDTTWKALPGQSPPTGFEQSGFDDSSWPAAVTEGNVNSSPWAPVTVSAGPSAPGTPLAGAPAGN